MSAAPGRAAPLRFLLLLVGGWVGARGLVLEGWRPGAPAVTVAERTPLPLRRAERPASLSALGSKRAITLALNSEHLSTTGTEPRRTVRVAASEAPDMPASATAWQPGPVATGATPAASPAPRPVAAIDGAAPPTPPATSRLSGSAWVFVRGGGRAPSLAPVGEIGGGQAGVRVLYRLAGTLAAAARVSRTIGGPDQTEAALGLDWRPVARLPVHLAVERRVEIDRGGRNAWSLGAAGGAYAVPLAEGWRLDGYAEAGVVGASRRDLYGDGAVRAGRALALGGGGASVTLGLGAWGAAQPGASRLDGGPSAVLRLPVSGRTIAAALDYRARLLGDARPHSGVALTVGVDF